MKTFGILVIVAVALYAIYELFSSNASLSSLIASGGTTGQSTATYTDVALPSDNTGTVIGTATALAASVVPTSVSDAFGTSDLSSDEDDVSDVTSTDTSDSLADFASGSGSSY